jgi:hypothetical protein
MSAALVALAAKVAAADSAESITSYLQVHTPQALFTQGGYDHREALFGTPPYGSSVVENVYYADSDLCDPYVDTRGGLPAREVDSEGNMEPWPSPYILMVDRGGCSFVQKVRHAQRVGATAVIVAENTCLCSDDDCLADSDQDSEWEPDCQEAEPILADDGSGGDISIPTMLMFKTDANQIKDELRANRTVQVEMSWELPKSDQVEYELWTTPSDLVSKEFQKNFLPAAQALGESAHFTPHMYTYDGVKSNCRGDDGENLCYNMCTNNGRYCATDPDNDLDHGISGADVVKESLRRICIWKHYGEGDGIGKEWWDYVEQFLLSCDTVEYFARESCVEDIYRRSGIKKDIIDDCLADSGGIEDDVTNSLLESELQHQLEMGVVILPSLFVNGIALRGATSLETVFTAICQSYSDDAQPEICVECAEFSGYGQCMIEKENDSMYQGMYPEQESGQGNLRGNKNPHQYINDMVETECGAYDCADVEGEALDCNITKPKSSDLDGLTKRQKDKLKMEIEEQILRCACCADAAIEDMLSREEGSSRV